MKTIIQHYVLSAGVSAVRWFAGRLARLGCLILALVLGLILLAGTCTASIVYLLASRP